MNNNVELTKYEYYDFEEMIEFIENKYEIEIGYDFKNFLYEHYWTNDSYTLQYINWKDIYSLIDKLDEIFKNKYLSEIEHYKSIYSPDVFEEVLKQLMENGFEEPEPDEELKLKYKNIVDCFYKEFNDKLLNVSI